MWVDPALQPLQRRRSVPVNSCASSCPAPRTVKAIRIETVNQFLGERYTLAGWCRTHRFRNIDLQVLVERGWGHQPVQALRGKITCALCRQPLELRVHALAPYSPEWNSLCR